MKIGKKPIIRIPVEMESKDKEIIEKALSIYDNLLNVMEDADCFRTHTEADCFDFEDIDNAVHVLRELLTIAEIIQIDCC